MSGNSHVKNYLIGYAIFSREYQTNILFNNAQNGKNLMDYNFKVFFPGHFMAIGLKVSQNTLCRRSPRSMLFRFWSSHTCKFNSLTTVLIYF